MERLRLRFTELVEEAFRFLENRFGFRLVRSEPPTLVRYESGPIFLNVYHGRRSYEIDVEVGRVAEPGGRSYRLRDVLDALGEPDAKRRTYFSASDPPGVRRAVEEAAELVASHYEPLLRGDEAAFQRVAERTKEHDREVTRGIVQRPVRDEAERAWRGRDYERVKELYGAIRADLSPTETKRLEYAERHAGPDKT
jgi:hypothetical protein